MIATLKSVRLTPAERGDVQWAFGAMCDYWGAFCEPDSAPGSYIQDPEGVVDNELAIPADALMPYLDGDVLVLSTWNEVNTDLVERIEDQLPEMAGSAKSHGGDLSYQRAGQIAARCARLGEKIRDAMEQGE